MLAVGAMTKPFSASAIASHLPPVPPLLPTEFSHPFPEQNCWEPCCWQALTFTLCRVYNTSYFCTFLSKGNGSSFLVPKYSTTPCFCPFLMAVPSARLSFPFLCLANSCSFLKTQFPHRLLQEALPPSG